MLLGMQIKAHILQDFKAGQIDEFYTEVYPSLLLYAARNLGDDFIFLGEDCVQDAIFEAYGRREKFHSPEQFKSFLYKCVYNNTVTIRRKNKSKDNYLAQPRNVSYNLQNAILEQETLDRLYEAIDRLPEDLAKVLELSFVQGLKNAEIAQRMNISESAVKKKKARMLGMLRETLGDDAVILLALLTQLALTRAMTGL